MVDSLSSILVGWVDWAITNPVAFVVAFLVGFLTPPALRWVWRYFWRKVDIDD